jgi:acyl-coenzyme A thioesterase PaaI-like protein
VDLSSPSLPRNPDQALLQRFLEDPGTPLAMETNPFAAALGGVLAAADPAAGTIGLAFRPGPAFLQGNGVIQGGAVTAMLDFAMAFAVLAGMPPEVTAATASLTVSFLAAAWPGEYVAEGFVERRGKRLAFARAELRPAAGGAPVATASSVLALLGG